MISCLDSCPAVLSVFVSFVFTSSLAVNARTHAFVVVSFPQILKDNPEIKTFESVFGELVVKRGPPRPPGGKTTVGPPAAEKPAQEIQEKREDSSKQYPTESPE